MRKIKHVQARSNEWIRVHRRQSLRTPGDPWIALAFRAAGAVALFCFVIWLLSELLPWLVLLGVGYVVMQIWSRP